MRVSQARHDCRGGDIGVPLRGALRNQRCAVLDTVTAELSSNNTGCLRSVGVALKHFIQCLSPREFAYGPKSSLTIERNFTRSYGVSDGPGRQLRPVWSRTEGC